MLRLTSDEWGYFLISYPKLALGQLVQIQLMGSAGLWNRPSYKASGNILVVFIRKLGLIFKLGQLIRYLVKNISIEKVYRKHAIKTSPIPRFKACVPYFLRNFYFSSNDSPSKTMEVVFVSSKKLFSFSKYSNVCTSIFPSFSPYQSLL